MDNIALMIFLSIGIPLALSLALFEKRARVTVTFLIAGMLMALIISQINTLLLQLFDYDRNFVTTTITPATEELIKALPILYFAFVFEPKKNIMINISFAVGLGFAIFENLVMLSEIYEGATVTWALIRGFGAGLMHSLCTLLVGLCTMYIRENKRLFVCGTFSMLALAIIYHSIYNCLVLSDYSYLGLILPMATYSPFIIYQILQKRREKKDV